MLFTERLSYAFSDPYSVGLLAGISEVAEQYRSGLLLIPLEHCESADPDLISLSVEAARQAVVDGVIAYCVDADHPAREVIRSRGLPIVSTNNEAEQGKFVLIDEVGAGRQVGKLIRKLGHRRVGIILDTGTPSGEVREITSELVEGVYDEDRLRLKGFREGLGKGMDVTVVTGGHNDQQSGQRAAAELLDHQDRPTAIIAASDVIALGVVEALRQRGLAPGRDVSVTGFDDIAAAGTAGLTTIRQPIRERGRLLGRMLLDPTYTETTVVLPTEIVVRSSTGPVPAR